MIKRPCQRNGIPVRKQALRSLFCSDTKNDIMKKILLSLAIACAVSFTASAQTEVKTSDKKVKVENKHAKTKVKKTSTPGQKVHNILHPKRKKYSGVRVKHEVKKEG